MISLTYLCEQGALDLLDGQRRKAAPGANFTPSKDGMLGWLNKLGHSVRPLYW